MTGLRHKIRWPVVACLLDFMMFRTLPRKACTFFLAGWAKYVPPYFRICCPRKSNPSLICVMWVFSGESVRPRSLRNASTSGLTSYSSSSLLLPVIMKSSAHLTMLTIPLRTLVRRKRLWRHCWSPSSVRFIRTGEISPPTKLQTFFFGIVITWIWVDPKHDIDLVTRDFHPLDQRSDEVALARPIGGLQTVVEFGGKVLQPANNQLQFALQGGLLRQRLALLLQPGEALAQAGNPGLKLGLIDEALRVTVDQPGHALASLADLVFDGGKRCVFGARLGLQAPPVFLRQSLRVGQQRTDFLPHRQVQQIGPYLRILTNPLTAKAIRVCAQAAIIGVGAWLAFPSTRAEALPVEGIATVLALEQALQEIPGAPARLPGMALVLPQLVLDGREHRGLHERRDRDRDPVLRGNITDGDGPARLHGPMALGSQPGPQGLQAGLAKRRGSLIGRILQEAPHDTPIPDGFAGAGHLASLRQPATDLANRQAVAADPGKDLADHAGFVRQDLIAGLPPSLVLGHIAVPIGRAAQHLHRPDAGRMPLPTPVAFDDLGALILGNHPLHWQEQIIFGTLAQGPVEEDDLHPGPPKLVDQQDLIGILTRQPIRGMHIHAVHRAPGDDITQALESGPNQGRSTIALVQKLHRLGHHQALGRDALAQGCYLAGDRMGLGVRIGRDAGVERHLCWIHGCGLLPTCCGGGVPSACGAECVRGAG